MQPIARVVTWSITMVGLSILQAANGAVGFLGQTITLPLWALLLFILLPGEAFADVARTAVQRFDGKLAEDKPAD